MQKFVPLIVGIIFIGVGCFLFFRNEQLTKNCTEEIESKVVEIKEELNTDSEGIDYMYYPILEFDYKGETVQVKMNSGSSSPSHNIGDKVIILYNPNNYKEFIVKGDSSSSIFSIVFMAIGTLVAIYGVVLLFKKK